MSDIVLPRRKTRIRETGKDRVFNAINLIFWIIVLFIVLYPLWLIIISSVSDPDAVRRAEVLIWPVDFSLMGYEAVFQHSELWNSYLNSIFYTLVGSAMSVIITLAAAYTLSRKFAGRKVVSLVITFTMFFSGGLIPIFINIKDMGLYDTRAVMILMNLVSVWNLMVARPAADPEGNPGFPDHRQFRYLLRFLRRQPGRPAGSPPEGRSRQVLLHRSGHSTRHPALRLHAEVLRQGRYDWQP